MTMVNSFDEWSPLQEVIVGSSFNYRTPKVELSFQLFYTEDATKENMYLYPKLNPSEDTANKQHELYQNLQVAQASSQKYLAELAEDLEGFVTALQAAGVIVHRPTPLAELVQFRTPYWEAAGIPALNIRDQAIIVGNEIIETAPLLRARYFENDLLKPIFYHYFRHNAQWTSMPRPMMTDRSFDLSDMDDGFISRPWEDVDRQQQTPFDVGHEMMIDAAQCIRFGRDILVNVSNKNHELGYQWLERHLSPKFRLHKLHRMTDGHIDSMVLPLRPGTLLVRNPSVREQLPEPLQHWDVIYPPEPSEHIFPDYAVGDLILTSKYIDLNVLSLNEHTVIANALFPELIHTLERHGFDVIPVQHRHRRIFGGGFHCFTLDTVRAGGLEDYFTD